jgi:calcineurin-like phosphoesterase family protein
MLIVILGILVDHDTKLISDINNRIINVSCEAANYTPISFEKILEVFK